MNSAIESAVGSLATARDHDGDYRLSRHHIPIFGRLVDGDTPVGDPHSERWRDYRTTVVEAEVTPGVSVCLNGAGACADWPFPGPVYVITGWNPQGVSLGHDSHRKRNIQIAWDILNHGGRFVHGEGRSPDGSHREPSLVAWGISRGLACLMGWKANQDAIVEIDAENFRLISCTDQHEESWERRA